jgi:hypothetical protein
MVVRIIIHCGMPKSGTTALQDFLDVNRAALLAQNILYPRSGRFGKRRTNHHAFFLSFSKKKELARTPFPTSQYSSHFHLRDLMLEIDTSGATTVILSSETLFGPAFDTDSLRDVKQALSFAAVTIYCVLRNQVDFIESMFAQRVIGPQKYFGAPKCHLKDMEDDGILDYDQKIRRFESVFGKDSVKICWYEDVRGDIIGPLSKLVNLKKKEGLTAIERCNVRRTWFFVFCLRWVRRLPFLDNDSIGRHALGKLEKVLCALGAQAMLDKTFQPYSAAERQRLSMQYAPKNDNIRTRHDLYWWCEPASRGRPIGAPRLGSGSRQDQRDAPERHRARS